MQEAQGNRRGRTARGQEGMRFETRERKHKAGGKGQEAREEVNDKR